MDILIKAILKFCITNQLFCISFLVTKEKLMKKWLFSTLVSLDHVTKLFTYGDFPKNNFGKSKQLIERIHSIQILLVIIFYMA